MYRTQKTSLPVMPHSRVHASHILLKDGATCQNLYRDILDGNIIFEEAAQRQSLCPSGKKGGDLGFFKQGIMIREFDDLAFDENIPLDTPQGCLATPFGYHIVKILDRQ